MQCNFNPPNFESLERASQMFSAISHPKRLHIITLIAEKSMSVTSIANEMGCEPPCTSQHLRILKAIDIVECKREGHEMLYCLKHKCILNAINCIIKGCEIYGE